MKNFLLASGVGLLLVGAVSGQESHLTSELALQCQLEERARAWTPAWNFDAGAGFNFHPRVGALVQFNDTQFDINAATLSGLGFPGGNVNLWSLTLNPIVHTNPRGPVDVYFIGGGGLYHWRQEFTQPTVAIFRGFDPFFGFYRTAVPAENVLTSYSVNKPGVNGGMGLSFGTRWNAKVYAEARYHRVIFGNFHADMVPVTFGVRW